MLGQDVKSWSVDGSGSSGGLPDFSRVDGLAHLELRSHAAPVTAVLTAAGLQGLSRQDLTAPLPENVRVPTILTDQPLRHFDALFHRED